MKQGITRKLILYFILVIVVFAFVIGGLFGITVRRATRSEVEQLLLNQSTKIADAIEDNAQLTIDRNELNNLLSRVNLEDLQVWVVSTQGVITTITETRMGMNMMRDYYALSKGTQELLGQVLSGEQLVSDRIRGVFNTETVTVGTPIEVNGKVVAALFISASVTSINALTSSTIRILLLSLGIGVILAILLGYFLSLKFVKPLNRANEAVNTLAMGNYEVYLETNQKDEIGQLSTNINSLAKRLDDASKQSANLEKMRQNFIADITHELRTPVTIIRGLAEGVKDQVYPIEDSPKISEQIIHETLGMQRLIQDLLDLSKLEDPDFKLDKHPIELHDVLDDVVRSARALLEQKQQILTVKIEEGSWSFNGDAQRLKQMFIATLDNASKFSPSNTNIEIHARMEDGLVIVDVVDQGVGMNELKQKELFQRYKKESQNNPDGNGLGLLIVSKIAANHHIRLEVESELDRGTTIRFKIPL